MHVFDAFVLYRSFFYVMYSYTFLNISIIVLCSKVLTLIDMLIAAKFLSLFVLLILSYSIAQAAYALYDKDKFPKNPFKRRYR